MLVLARQRDEEIVVRVPASTQQREITFTVVDVRGDKVRIGVIAPKDVTIHRGEVQKLIDRENSK